MSDITVRVGTPDDLDAMMEITIEASYDNGFVDPDPLCLLEHVYPALHLNQGVVGIIGAPGERIEAAILLRMGPTWYSSAPILDEKAIYVRPEFRAAKGGRAKLLAEFARRYALELDVPLSIGVLSNERTAAKVRMYSRIFGEPAGVYFLFNAKTGTYQQAAE